MDDFDILNDIINEEEKVVNEKDKCEVGNCPHENVREENSKIHCIDCGFEIKHIEKKDWHLYGIDDTKKSSDPMRCQIRKSEDKNIYKDVEGMDFSDKVIAYANDLYQFVTHDKIYRGNSRKAIVFACIFNAFKTLGNPQSCESFQSIFKLERKVMLKGLKHVSLNAPKEMELQCKYITPIEIINEIMDKLNADKIQKDEVIIIYNKIKNKSLILNRSKPQSIASGIIFYYIKLKNKQIDITTFMKKVNLSESTIVKITNEVEKLLN
jgi:hypothetical protein